MRNPKILFEQEYFRKLAVDDEKVERRAVSGQILGIKSRCSMYNMYAKFGSGQALSGYPASLRAKR